MKNIFIRKLMALTIASMTVLGFGSVTAHAEWRKHDTHTLYFKDNAYLTGWQSIEGKWYYFNGDGYMAYNGWDYLNNKWYYFNQDGSMASNTTTPDGYNVGSDGSWIQNNTNNINSNNTTNINNGIINNGGNSTNIINNYIKSDDSVDNNDSSNVEFPISIPSNWTKITNTSYAINNRTPLVYQVKDTFGANEDDILFGIKESLILKTGYDVTEKTYNGYKTTCFEYLDVTKKGIEKFYYVVFFGNNKVYGIMMCGNQDNYEADKQELENVLNNSLEIN